MCHHALACERILGRVVAQLQPVELNVCRRFDTLHIDLLQIGHIIDDGAQLPGHCLHFIFLELESREASDVKDLSAVDG